MWSSKLWEALENHSKLLRASLEQGKPIVTANKNLLAEHGDELFRLAAAHNLPIGFEASVAGGIPILRVIHESTAGDRLRSVHGILNGTANYILTQMETREIDFAEALAEAQKAGFAEADPSFDIDGQDARDKLCILARMAFEGRLKVARIPTYGIRHVRAIDIHSANRLDSTIRLVGSAEQTDAGLEVSVRPWLVSRRSMLAKVEGVNNAVFLVGDKIGTQMFYGRGAGGDATGSAVVSDLIEIARDLAAGQMNAKNISGFLNSRELELSETPRPVSWYLRLTVKDQRGIVARVAEVIARESINDRLPRAGTPPAQGSSFFCNHGRTGLRAGDSACRGYHQLLRVHDRTCIVAADRRINPQLMCSLPGCLSWFPCPAKLPLTPPPETFTNVGYPLVLCRIQAANPRLTLSRGIMYVRASYGYL